jgi:hypothetical protein
MNLLRTTILRLLEQMGCACAEYHNRAVRNLKWRRVQCDEIWTFVYAKQNNVTEDGQRCWRLVDVEESRESRSRCEAGLTGPCLVNRRTDWIGIS